MPTRRAAIFDLDGTLIDSAPAITRALGRLRAERDLPPLEVAQVRPWVSLGAATLVGRALECSGNADTTEIAAFRSAYAEYPGAPEDLYPGIVDALTALRHADVTLGVCTNKPQALSEHVLNATGIAAHFTAVVGGDATPRTKPDAAHVLHTLSNMGCDGLPFDFIGDSSIDARAARACDARFLWAAWGYADATDLGHYGRRLLAPSELTAAILEAACA